MTRKLSRPVWGGGVGKAFSKKLVPQLSTSRGRLAGSLPYSLSGSTEARRSKAFSYQENRQSRRSIRCFPLEAGRRRHTWETAKTFFRPCWLKVVSSDEPEQVPPGGSDHIRTTRKIGWNSRKVRSTSAGVGSARRGDTRARTWRSGSAIATKVATMKSSTMKGPQGLAGKL